MLLTGSSGNGALLGWDLKPLKQSAKLWLHDAGITNVREFVSNHRKGVVSSAAFYGTAEAPYAQNEL